jgi:uncharacterized membrane protein
MIFDFIAMTFDFIATTFESIAKIFDAAIMTFESVNMVFDSVFDMIFDPASSRNLTLRLQEIRPLHCQEI